MGSVKLNNSYSMNGEQRLDESDGQQLTWPWRIHLGGRPSNVPTPDEILFLPGMMGCAYSLQVLHTFIYKERLERVKWAKLDQQQSWPCETSRHYDHIIYGVALQLWRRYQSFQVHNSLNSTLQQVELSASSNFMCTCFIKHFLCITLHPYRLTIVESI